MQFKSTATELIPYLRKFIVVVEGVGGKLLQPALKAPSVEEIEGLGRGREVSQDHKEPGQPGAEAVARDAAPDTLGTRRVTHAEEVGLLQRVMREVVSLINATLCHQLA